MLKKDKKIVIIYNVVHIIYYIFYKLKMVTNTITSHFLNVVIGDIICIAFFFLHLKFHLNIFFQS